jgi:outer membrane protein insertion porin family
LSLFYDVGNVFSGAGDWAATDLRMSVGLGATWLSPVGPLAVSVAQPFNDQSGDNLQQFQFTLGAGF